MDIDFDQYNVAGLIDLSDKEFQLIANLMYEKFGIHLSEKKKSLVKGRLQKLIKSLNFTNFTDYYHYIVDDKSGKGLLDCVDKISTNHTYFFREHDHFDFLVNNILPELQIKNGEKKIKIWSAGCSSGEEPYSIAILLNEYFKNELPLWNIGILGTDISLTVLNKALEGKFMLENIGTLPGPYLTKYFDKHPGGIYTVKQFIRNMVLFKRLNLMRGNFPFKGKFNVIFCRNVMIYFNTETRYKLVDHFYQYIEKGGYLFIGHSESLDRKNSPFQYIQPAVYRKI